MKRSFTLVELLVVVAIILLLAALLMPALKGAREKARAVVCASNLRQHHLAFMAYSGDYQESVVPFASYNPNFPGDPNEALNWMRFLLRYKYLPREIEGAEPIGPRYLKVGLKCPSNHNGYLPGPYSPAGNIYYDGQPNYMYNAVAGGFGGWPMLKLSQIAGMSAKAILFEGGEYAPWGTPYACQFVIQNLPVYFDHASINYSIGDIHNGRSHVLFWDGHVDSFAKGQIDWKVSDLTNP